MQRFMQIVGSRQSDLAIEMQMSRIEQLRESAGFGVAKLLYRFKIDLSINSTCLENRAVTIYPVLMQIDELRNQRIKIRARAGLNLNAFRKCRMESSTSPSSANSSPF